MPVRIGTWAVSRIIGLIDKIIEDETWNIVHMSAFRSQTLLGETKTGSASVSYGLNYVSPRTGVVANSLYLQTNWGFVWGLNDDPAHGAPDSWDATKRLIWEFTVSREGDDAECVGRVQMKVQSDLAEGDLADVGLGVRVDNYAVTGEAFGSARQTVDLGSITSSAYRFKIKYYPGDRIEFWKNGVYIGQLTGTALPSNAWLNKIMALSVSLKNGATGGATPVLYVSNMKFYKRNL